MLLETVLLCFTLVYAMFVVSDVVDLAKRLRFNKRLNRMVAAIKSEVGKVCILCCPTIDGPLASAAGCQIDVYEFTEIDMNGRERKIFVNRDCSNVEVFPWTKKSELCATSHSLTWQ